MDIRSINCLVAVMVFLIVPFIKGQTNLTNAQTASPVNNTGQTNTSVGGNVGTKAPAVVAGGNKTGNGKNGTGTMNGTGGGSGQTNTSVGGNVGTKAPAVVAGGNKTGNVKNGTGTINGAVTPKVTPKVTTPKPKQCVKGKCTAKGEDESCLSTITGKCPLLSTGSCTTLVTKNASHTTVNVDCSPSACPPPGTPTTSTAKPPTTSTNSCCNTDLCNQYQNSAAVSLTTNMLYAIGLILINVYL
ncbi:variant surface antigen A-like isoform X2 [Mercenaria mercenaria]|uniref:variant surface antigen A-like isoform X2 n=1 Tax=Mercenaria mercenaria TaxID=6596 RepID=UPI00234EE66A|nr:variant surface antigen A-like isoform X2 [Mercenaria mercenaria]